MTRLQARCDAAGSGAGTTTGTAAGDPALYYLHADHLGRPKVATDTSGAIVWDGGLTTPFGQGITTPANCYDNSLEGAITQKLMFPGQYADEETGYSRRYCGLHRFI